MTKIACSTGIRSTKSLEEACQSIHDLGFTYVDPLAIAGWHVNPSRLVAHAQQEADRVRAVCEAYRLECVAVNLGFVHGFTTCSAEQHQENLQVVRGASVLAQALDTSILTMGTGGMGDDDRGVVLDRVSERLREVVAVAAGSGMTVALETHAGAIAVYPDAAREILDRCPGLSLTYDPSHYIAEQIPIQETLELLAYTAHVHLRNARVGHFQERMSTGLLDIPWMVDQIVASGYQGAVSIEYIEDCGAIQEGYETTDEVLILKQILLDKGLDLGTRP